MLCGRTGLTAPLWAAIICVAAAGAQGTRMRPGPQLPRDSLGSLRSGTAVLRGRVVDGLTGEGIPRARVRLLGNRNARVPVLTDAGGAFEFRDLPGGVYSLRAERVTYLPVSYPDRSGSLRAVNMRPVLLRNGETRDDVVVRMFRGGAIAGRVLDGYGDPVDNVEIRVLHARRGAGAEGPSRSVRTNDLGEYRVGQLRPGAYLVMAVRNSHTVDVPLDGARPLPQPLPTLYPSTPSPSEAVPLVVERGGTLTDVEITLVEGVPTIVTGTLISDDGRPLASDQRGGGVNARLVNRELPGLGWIGHGSAIRPDGTFQLTLAPGEYVVQAHLSGGEPDRPLMGLTRLVAGGEAMHVTIPVGRGATAAGRVVFAGATPAPPAGSDTRVGVPLQSPEGGECNSGRLQVSRDWTFKVEGLFGTCGAPSLGAYGRWMLKSVTIGGVDVTHSTVTFQSGEHYSDVQIVVTDRGAELNLAVTDEHGQVSRDYVGVVFPADRDRWREPFAAVRTYSPQSPEYVEMLRASGVVPMPPLREAKAPRQAVLGLAPGDYFAIALDDIDGESAHDPAVLERLASSAVRVSLVDGSSQVTLRRLRFADLMR